AVAEHGWPRTGELLDHRVRGGQVAIDVGGHRVGRVALVGDAPVDEEDVVAALEQALDEAVAGAQVPDVAAVDEAGHEQQGWPAASRPGPVAAQRRTVTPPHHEMRGAAGPRPVEPAEE